MRTIPVVYLDSSDYSRFGDVLRGKSDAATEKLFLDLERRRLAGDVIFAASMPILGELLQYDQCPRDITIRKAEAVERLCGSWALAFPSRLVAADAAEAASRRGLLIEIQDNSVLSSDRYWFPNVADSFRNIHDDMHAALQSKLTALELPTRTMRRQAKKVARKFNPAKAAGHVVSEFAAKYGLPKEAVTESVGALLRGVVTPDQASKRLFSAIAEPVKFVEIFFETAEIDASQLPAWMGEIGRNLEGHLADLRETILPFMKYDFARKKLGSMLDGWAEQLSRTALGFAREDHLEFGISVELFQQLAADPNFASEVPACRIVGKALVTYIAQISGLSGSEAKIEHSFGGDLVHALYLPHVDLWRGDRRFAGVVKAAVPQYSKRVISSPKDILGAIDKWRPQHLA